MVNISDIIAWTFELFIGFIYYCNWLIPYQNTRALHVCWSLNKHYWYKYMFVVIHLSIQQIQISVTFLHENFKNCSLVKQIWKYANGIIKLYLTFVVI